MFEHNKDAAVNLLKALDSCNDTSSDDDITTGTRDHPWTQHMKWWTRRIKTFVSSQNNTDGGDILPMTCPTSAETPAKTDRSVQDQPNPQPPDPEMYVCALLSSLTYKTYLHHVDVNKAKTDPQLFLALRRKYFHCKPLWKRVFTLRSLARVEYFEVSKMLRLYFTFDFGKKERSHPRYSSKSSTKTSSA